MTNPEIQNELFALRLQYEEEMMDEISIIQEMKYFLHRKNLSPEDSNSAIANFYLNYGIPLTLEEIQNVPLPQLQPAQIQIFTFPLNPQVSFENYMPLNPINLNTNTHQEVEEQEPEDNNNEEEPEDNNEEEQEDTNNEEEQEDQEEPIPHQNPFNLIQQLLGGTNLNALPPHIVLSQMMNFLNNPPHPPNIPQFQDVVTTLEEKELDKIEEEELTEDIDDVCPISMMRFDKGTKVMKLPCSHMFVSQYIKEYLKEYNYKCPVCKKEVGKSQANLS